MKNALKTNLPISNTVFAIDCVVFGFEEGELKTLLIERTEEPYRGCWTLPGYLVVDQGESIDEAANRVLCKLTGLTNAYLEQVYTYTNIDRYAESRVISVVYYAMIRLDGILDSQHIASYTRNAALVPVNELPELGFDHASILERVLKKVRCKVLYYPIAFELLPEKFTLTQLQSLYEAILGRKLDKRNFRKKIMSHQILMDLNEKQKDVSYRAAKLFKLDKKKHAQVVEHEFSFSEYETSI